MSESNPDTPSSHDDLMEIYWKCRKKVGIAYNDLGFFDPRLRSINFLSIGRSRFISNPITILLELGYRAFMFCRNALQALARWLFPKNLSAVIPMTYPLDSCLVGRITFSGRRDVNTPIHHMKVIFWARTWLLQWRKIAEGITDHDGVFELPFSIRAAKGWSVFRRRFEIYQTTYTYGKSPIPSSHYELFHSQIVPGLDLVGMRYDLRTIQLFYWEYRTDTTVPRTAIKNHDKDAPQYYSQGRLDAMNQQILPIELTKLSHLERIAKDPAALTINDIQGDYPENLTRCMECTKQGVTRSDEWFGLRMMNGMYAATFVPVENEPEYYFTRIYGACTYQVNDQYAFPTVEIKFHLDTSGIMMPREIRFTGPLTARDTDPWICHTVNWNDGDQWLYAKRVARVTGALSTELDDHFTGTHLVTEQYAIAAYRNLQLSPLAALLFPHLKEVALINHAADSILIGPAKPPPLPSPIRSGGLILWIEDQLNRILNRALFEEGGYIPQASALTHSGTAARILDMMGVQDWKHWHPMEPLSDKHIFPKIQQAYWDILGHYIDVFFQENREDIRKHWYEIFCFSRDLVAHAVPLYGNLEHLNERERQLVKERLAWYQQRYAIDYKSPRMTIDDELKVLSPLTTSESFNENDLDNVKQACRYIIMMATFMHSFVNEQQYNDIGEVLYNSLGLRFGDGEHGVLAPESDTRISPDLTRSTQMMWFSNLLSRTEYGFIVRNEEGDINPQLVEMLKDRRNEIEKHDPQFRVSDIESRTNI